MIRPVPTLLAVAVASACCIAHAEPAAAPDQAKLLDRMTVVGSAKAAQESAGSAAYLDGDTLQKHDYRDIQRVLRQVPGVYVVDEEGYGLRPNIGIRGSGTDRNSRITVMEDGVLVAPAAYAAPAAYYFPTTARINAIEVRKGSSAIRSGPRTTGGTINLISTPIPQQTSGQLNFAFGTDETVQAHAWAGGSGEQTGWLVETAQQQTDGFKRLDSGGDTGYVLEDYLAKFRINSAADATRYQSLEIKLGKTEQDADETYLGLTDEDFRANPNRRYAGSQKDNIKTDHELAELRHHIELSPAVDLTTVAYRHEFARNWFKLNDVRNGTVTTSISSILDDPTTFATEYAWLTGATSDNGALRVRNNNRSYQSQGVQSVLGWATTMG
ncbi:MAG: TonB-dependent receptor plug domain-containing protein, partial [Pseudomonadota bacterium]|nr:TonB-dependent receptor plug domain-containing protein [Pseudomonadota bacterium]